jgi:hypothetical protein
MRFKVICLFIFCFLLWGGSQALADCDINAPNSGDTVTCNTAAPNPDVGVINNAADNVTVNVLPGAIVQSPGDNGIALQNNAIINNQGTVDANNASGIFINNNGNITNTGSISNNPLDGILGNNNNTLNNTGNINNNGSDGVDINSGTVINGGQINHNGDRGVEFDSGSGTLINSGSIANNGGFQVSFTTGTDLVENLPGGQIIDTPGQVAIRFDGGNDTMIVHVNSLVVGTMDGGPDFDTLTFTGPTDDEAGWAQVQAFSNCNPCAGTITLNGRSYTFTNFEALRNLLTLIGRGQLDGGPVVYPKLICDDGYSKVFTLANGDLEVYSGFDLRPVNGFLVAKITALQLEQGLSRHQNPAAANPGWYTLLELSPNPRELRVFEAGGRQIGAVCRF